MSSLYDEYEALLYSIGKKYQDLEELNLQHQLLDLVQVESIGDVFTIGGDFTGGHIIPEREFRERYPFNPDDLHSCIGALCEYEDDLERAVQSELKERLEEQGLLEKVRVYF